MCILCVVQRWSRRVATMLPWLVMPLLLLWGASQLLLPASYRFEVTSPRLACVSVLLLTLFWYEILLPRLSHWRARRSARLREERRARALELHKLRKTATRRCRNCNNPYRDQNPGGGKFMCSYCGHVSKRPVLDLNSAGKVPRGWPCSQDCDYWPEVRCPSDNSFLGFSRRLFSSFSVTMRWLLSKVFRFTSSEDSEADGKRLAKRGENGGKAEESRVEKAKRKAEEKRLARLEREMLEEEERKQREEVAKLVEERRKLRDEKAEAEERSKGATPVGEKDARREADKRRLDKRKKEDKGSSKSNSDCEDVDRRLGREGDRKRDLDRKGEPERRDAYKPHFEANNHSSKVVDSKAKYFGRMTSGFLSSSRGFGGGSFFGRSAQASAPQGNKVSRPVVPAIDPSNTVKRDFQPAAAQAAPKSATAGETRSSWTNLNRPVSPNVHPHPTAPKKSWHQLFNRSASVSPCPDVAASGHEINRKPEPNGAQISNAHNFLSQYPPLDSKPNISQSMQFPGFSPVKGAPSNTALPHFPAGHMPSYEAEPTVFEELEQFEDPCYDPDAIALLGPVSESLDNFPQDLDCGFISSGVTKESHQRPSPIESPISRFRTVEEKPLKPQVTKGPDGSTLPQAYNEQGTWQMWSTPLVQETLALQGPQSQWLLPTTNQISQGAKFLNSGTRSPLCTNLNDSDPWQQKTPIQQLPPDTPSLFLPHVITGKVILNDLGFGSPNKSARTSPIGPSGLSWSKKEDPTMNGNGLKESDQFCSPRGAHVDGGFFSPNPDVQSVWSFNEKETT